MKQLCSKKIIWNEEEKAKSIKKRKKKYCREDSDWKEKSVTHFIQTRDISNIKKIQSDLQICNRVKMTRNEWL